MHKEPVVEGPNPACDQCDLPIGELAEDTLNPSYQYHNSPAVPGELHYIGGGIQLYSHYHPIVFGELASACHRAHPGLSVSCFASSCSS